MGAIFKSRVDRGKQRQHLVDFKKWQKIQNLFAKIVGVNISFFDPSGHELSTPSRITPNCSELAVSSDSKAVPNVFCSSQALGRGLEGHRFFSCRHQLSYLILNVHSEEEPFGLLVLGPFLTGKREEKAVYEKVCREFHLDCDLFFDGLQELKLFSHTSLSVISDFLCDIAERYLVHVSQSTQLKRLIPSFSSSTKEVRRFFSAIYVDELSNSLLGMAMALVKADSGSVLFFDEKKISFQIKASRGLDEQYRGAALIPLSGSIAGWVAKRGRPFLIRQKMPDSGLRKQLRRPEIKASFVIPLRFKDEILGVLCLNTKSSRRPFTEKHLILLSQLGSLAGAALSHP